MMTITRMPYSICERTDNHSNMKLVFCIKIAISKWEAGVISERTVLALQTKKAKSERISGKAPYGYRFENGMVVEDEPEQEVIRIIHKWTTEGLSISNIINFLAENGYTNRNKKPFGRAEVWKIQKAA